MTVVGRRISAMTAGQADIVAAGSTVVTNRVGVGSC